MTTITLTTLAPQKMFHINQKSNHHLLPLFALQFLAFIGTKEIRSFMCQDSDCLDLFILPG